MDKGNRRRALKLRFRRHLRVQKRQVEELGAQAEQRLEDDFFKRLERLGAVRRFVSTWMLLLVLLAAAVVTQTRALSKYYQVLTPVPGGTYTEGILGSFTNANPLYATDVADSSVSRLVFAGLLTYDQNNQLTGDLASNWQVNQAGTVYTLTLRPDLKWHDGVPLTSADVLFTYQVIQNPDARSPLYNSWQGITVAAPDSKTVTFTLPNPLASFPYSLTNGIVPKHLLVNTPMVDMRSQAFNSVKPVGAGPFKWQAIELIGNSADSRQEHIALKPFEDYHVGKAKVNNFVIRTFRSADQLVDSFKNKEVDSIVGLLEVPEELRREASTRVYNLPLTAEVMIFFKTTQGVLSDAKVRQALVQGANPSAIIEGLDYPTMPVKGPLLRTQLGYNPNTLQANFDPLAAMLALDAAGWSTIKKGVRYKGETPLTFQLFTHATGEYARVAKAVADQWRAIGVDAKVVTQENTSTFQSTLSYHTYDAVIYGVSVGVDPDVYAYWHSSQADVRAPVRLNLSEYNSPKADASLEDARTRLDPALRAVKYQPFLQAWQADAPALGLYQPRFLYITRGQVHGLGEHAINADHERFTNIHNWMVREAWQTPTE